MAANETKIVLTAEDKTANAFASVQRGLQGMGVAGLVASNALSAIGVTFSGAAAVALVKGTIDAADGFNDLAQKVGIGVKELAGWTLAASQSGTSMESVAKGIKSLSTYMVENSDKMKAAGVTATDANGALIQLADMFKAMPDGVEKTALAVQLFGKAGMDMIPMLNQGSAGLADAFSKADAYGRKMAELAPLADEFNDQMAEFALHSKAAGVNITSYFMPGLVGLSKWLNDVASGGKKAWNAVAWVVGGLPDGVTLGDDAKPATAPAAAAAGPVDPSKLLGKGGKPGRAGGGGLTPLQRLLAAQEKNIAGMNSGYDEQTVSVDTITRQYEKALEDRAAAMAAAHEARMEQQRIELEGEGAVQEWIDKNNKALEKQNDIGHDLGLTFASAFEDAIVGGKKFSEVLKGLGDDILRIVTRKTITEPLAAGISDLVKGFDFGKFFGGARASGGPVSSGKAYLVGENGPELFAPGASGAIIPSGAMGGSNVSITVNNTAAGVDVTPRVRNNGGNLQIDLLVAQAISKDFARNGPITQGMGAMFGMQRAVGAS